MLKIAEERIDILFKLAEESYSTHPHRSDRYVEMARNIATKYNIRMPRIWKRRFCKKCYKFLKPGENCQIRLKNSCVIIKCLECGNVVTLPYIREQKDKRRRRRVESHIIKEGINE
ncbi:ribonuclease P [Methanobacterium sp. A39]|uniref:Ribonuclease P protein component 4 n=2 Tax=Methanobacteriaceae TaxID=2159 RepID=A0A2A2HAH0_METBR|nr:ribonuclease P [Methanobacterium sp. A39]PAV06399.1 ribonuclease P [Methanobacterium bryantii]